jgi:hypothetical protein
MHLGGTPPVKRKLRITMPSVRLMTPLESGSPRPPSSDLGESLDADLHCRPGFQERPQNSLGTSATSTVGSPSWTKVARSSGKVASRPHPGAVGVPGVTGETWPQAPPADPAPRCRGAEGSDGGAGAWLSGGGAHAVGQPRARGGEVLRRSPAHGGRGEATPEMEPGDRTQPWNPEMKSSDGSWR